MSVLSAAERQSVKTLIADLVRVRMPAEDADRVLAGLEAHLDEADTYLMRGPNPPRADRDPEWDQRRGEAVYATHGVGAVHLELGTFTSFPDARIAEIVEADGLSEFLRLDFDRQYAPDLVADSTALPLRNASVDRVASNSLIEHVAYPHKLIEESFRVLRPGGIMEVAMPFVIRRHGYPHDYVRLTPQFFERVCRETGFAEVHIDDDGSSGLYNTLHNASKMAGVTHGRPETEAMRAVHEAVITMLGSLIPADRHFDDRSHQWFHSVCLYAVKPGVYEPSHRPRDSKRPLIERTLDLLADPATKAPLTWRSGRLECAFSGMAYPVERDMAIFTEPRQLEPEPEPLRERAREAARTVKGRLDSARSSRSV